MEERTVKFYFKNAGKCAMLIVRGMLRHLRKSGVSVIVGGLVWKWGSLESIPLQDGRIAVSYEIRDGQQAMPCPISRDV